MNPSREKKESVRKIQKSMRQGGIVRGSASRPRCRDSSYRSGKGEVNPEKRRGLMGDRSSFVSSHL